MSFPPSFPSRIPLLPRPMGHQPAVQKFGFFSQATQPSMLQPVPMMRPPMMNMNARNAAPAVPIIRPANPLSTTIPAPASKVAVPATTVFVGNISEKCPDDLVKKILLECGVVSSWKRMQDSVGKKLAFGFCEFEHPTGTLNALSVLNGYLLGDKRLAIKTDENTNKMLDDFKSYNASVDKEDDEKAKIDKLKEKIKLLIELTDPTLLNMDEEEVDPKKNQTGRRGSESPRHSKSRSHKRRRSSRSTSPGHHRNRTPTTDEKPRRSRSGRESSIASSLSSVSVKHDRRNRRHSRSRRSRSISSDDSYEKRRIKKENRDKEESYQKRLKSWEERERKMARQHAKDQEAELERQKILQKEARKLRQFLEDYEDERDDSKFYKGSSLTQRRRNYDREREADLKDRLEEQRELDELKRLILRDKEPSSPSQDGYSKDYKTNGYSSEHEQTKNGHENVAKPPGTWAAFDGSDVKTTPEQSIATNKSDESPSVVQKTGAKLVTLPKSSSACAVHVSTVFGYDDDEEDGIHQIKKKIKPFEITREDRIQSMTPEERKKMIKDLIERIPTTKDKIFIYQISWEFLDTPLLENRIRPWVSKKICEYIGEEEQSLVTFICESVSAQNSAEKIMKDLSMVLDEESEVFMVKLWRLIIYETEAKKLGLNSISGI